MRVPTTRRRGEQVAAAAFQSRSRRWPSKREPLGERIRELWEATSTLRALLQYGGDGQHLRSRQRSQADERLERPIAVRSRPTPPAANSAALPAERRCDGRRQRPRRAQCPASGTRDASRSARRESRSGPRPPRRRPSRRPPRRRRAGMPAIVRVQARIRGELAPTRTRRRHPARPMSRTTAPPASDADAPAPEAGDRAATERATSAASAPRAAPDPSAAVERRARAVPNRRAEPARGRARRAQGRPAGQPGRARRGKRRARAIHAGVCLRAQPRPMERTTRPVTLARDRSPRAVMSRAAFLAATDGLVGTDEALLAPSRTGSIPRVAARVRSVARARLGPNGSVPPGVARCRSRQRAARIELDRKGRAASWSRSPAQSSRSCVR